MVESNSVITYDGNAKNWKTWSNRFKAKSCLIGYEAVMDGRVSVVPESKSTTDASELEIRKANRTGYCELLLEMTGDECMQIVAESRTVDLPSGYVKTGWEALVEKFEPKDVTRKIKLMDQLASLTIGPNESADGWMQQLRNIRRQLKNDFAVDMSDEDMVTRMFMNLPKEHCKDLIVSFSRQMSSKVDPLTEDSMLQQLRAYGFKGEDHEGNEPPNAAFYSKPFKGQCRICGKYGHSGNECKQTIWNKGNNEQNSGEEIRCPQCNKTGHIMENCWKNVTCNACG